MHATTPITESDLPRFQSRFTDCLPADPETGNFRRQVTGACFSRVAPTPVRAPRSIAWWPEVAALLELPEAFCRSQAFAEVMGGNRLLPGMDPYAMCYGGHQFGNWAGQLGDGRAINLGEIVNSRGERYVLQLKGAGPTPYSRMADGLAVLRSSVREFICSEAMHHLGVPTTRALSLVGTGEQVMRDMFYDGNPKAEPGAVVCRVAPSFIRFGNFEILASRGDTATLRQLLDYHISTDFPELGEPGRDTWLAWFREVCRRTAEMIVHWLRVGFVHGVMNTDNLSTLGLTIDYGPYGWLDNYDPDWTPNTTDAHGRRYRYGHQPQIAQWNLVQLANAIHPLVEDVEALQDALEVYASTFDAQWRAMMAAKLGLRAYQADTDDALTQDLLSLLTAAETDMTLFYRALAQLDSQAAQAGSISDDALLALLHPSLYLPEQADADWRGQALAWLRAYAGRLVADQREDAERALAMNRVNPLYVARNYLAQQAIDRAEQGDDSGIHELMDVLRRPYEEQPGREAWAARRPDWARERAGCSMLSCSS